MLIYGPRPEDGPTENAWVRDREEVLEVIHNADPLYACPFLSGFIGRADRCTLWLWHADLQIEGACGEIFDRCLCSHVEAEPMSRVGTP